jgi:D-alanine transaminase
MSIAFLNGEYMPISEAKISPLDRGFLFGDGIYEVIPTYFGKKVGFQGHIDRLNKGLQEIGIDLGWSDEQWCILCDQLVAKNSLEAPSPLGIYLQVTRGADNKRFHGFPDPEKVSPTVFAMAFDIADPKTPNLETIGKGYALISTEDLRWKRCQIKSTALLGNVLHFQQGYESGCQETLLFNSKRELTEASSSNLFIVKNGVIATPPQDNQILAGITRRLLIDILEKDATLTVEERIISLEEAQTADEIWVTSSTKNIAPITVLDGKAVGSGKVGPIWLKAATLFAENKFDY